MVAALRALRRLQAASPARILPSSSPGPFPKLPAAAVASTLPFTRGAHSSPALVPSLLPVRHHGSTSTNQFNCLEQCQCSDEEAVQFVLEKLQSIDKTLEQLKRIMLMKVALLGLFSHAFYSLFYRLDQNVSALEEKVAKLESRQRS